MTGKNPKVDAFLARAKSWRPEMEALRAILLDCGLTEDFKWYKPCYTFQNANVVIMAGLKNHCWLAFLRGALLKDAGGLLEKPGPNSRSGRVIKFTSVPQITGMRGTLRAYILEAIEAEKDGSKVDMAEGAALEYPAELTRKLAEDPALKAAFEALTPGRQRGYILHFSAAKQSGTRDARIEKHRPRILQGMGLHDR